MTASLFTLAALFAAPHAWAAPQQQLPISLASGERPWRTVDGSTVKWEGRDEAARARLEPGGGYAGISAALPEEAVAGLVALELAVSADGKAEFVLGFSSDGESVPTDAAWVVDLPSGKRRLAARLAPPAAGSAPLHMHLGARGKGAVAIGELVAVSEEVNDPVEGPATIPALPADWEPGGNLDAAARRMGEAEELFVQVNGVEFSLVGETACSLGAFAPLTALVTNRGGPEKRLTVSAECPEGLAFEPREFPLTRAGTDRAILRLQGLLPGAYAAKINVSCGTESASLPVRATVGRGYPAFGTASVEGNQVTGRWQLREMLVRASPDSTVEDLLAQVKPHLDGPTGIPAIHFDGLPNSEVLRAFVTALKGRVGLYGPAWRPDRPFAGEDPRTVAEVLLAASREVFSVVRTTDLDAAVVSPVFDHSANQADSPENRLLNTCLDLGMNEYFAALTVAAPVLPAGGVLGESQNGRNLKDASLFWRDIDLACYPGGVDATLEAHDVYVPVLTSNIGGRASVDERLDALKVAHALACAAYVGCTGATLRESGGGGEIALLRADGTLSATGIAVKELSRDLAGARAIAASWGTKDVPGRPGEPIVVLPFLRDTEAILVIWNNTSVARHLTLTLRDVPYTEHTLTISHDDPFVWRTYQAPFRFSKEAVKANAREVYVRSAPLQVLVMRYRFRVALPTWLGSIEFTPKSKLTPSRSPRHDDRPWWKKLQDWAEGKE